LKLNQSGHGDSDGAMRWLTSGPPSRDWRTEPILPFINLEPNYEGHKGYTHRKPFGAHAVRRAAYWSLLVSPPAGVSYGAPTLEWWRLRPAQDILVEQPGAADPSRFVAAAVAEDGKWALLYLPVGGKIAVHTEGLAKPLGARWFNPRAGTWAGEAAVTAATQVFEAPDDNDWVLWIGSEE
jgi:hypothetical protein